MKKVCQNDNYKAQDKLPYDACTIWPFCPFGKKLMLSALKVKCFQPDFAIFLAHFFANSENAPKFKETTEFEQEMLNISSELKFEGSHWAFYE